MKKQIERNGQIFEVGVYYNLGGMNYFTGKKEPRGYYFSVSPVNITTAGNGYVIKSYTAFSGVKELLFEVKRKSKKSMAKAEEMVTDEMIETRIQYLLKKNNIAV